MANVTEQVNQKPILSLVGRRPWLPRIPLSGGRDFRRHRIPFTRRTWFQGRAVVNPRDLRRQYKLDDKRPWYWVGGLAAAFILPILVGSNLVLTAATTFALYAAINLMWMLVIGTAGRGDYRPIVGTVHSDFLLPQLDDDAPVSLSQFRGSKVLLIHFASW